MGKCQSNDFEAMIATISLAFMHYTVLALGKRFEDYERFGEIFRAFKDKLLEQKLIQRIGALLEGVYLNCLKALGVVWEDFMLQVIGNVDLKQSFADGYRLPGGGHDPESKLSIL